MRLNPEMTASREPAGVREPADSTETPQWLGVEVSPGSENTAERQRAQREHGRSHAGLLKKCRRDKAGPAEQPPGAFGAAAAGSERIRQAGQESLAETNEAGVAVNCQLRKLTHLLKSDAALCRTIEKIEKILDGKQRQ